MRSLAWRIDKSQLNESELIEQTGNGLPLFGASLASPLKSPPFPSPFLAKLEGRSWQRALRQRAGKRPSK